MSEMDARETGDPAEETRDEEAPIDVEVPEADAVEQQREVDETDDDRPGGPVPLDAAEYDAAEQSRVVELDEDDYR